MFYPNCRRSHASMRFTERWIWTPFIQRVGDKLHPDCQHGLLSLSGHWRGCPEVSGSPGQVSRGEAPGRSQEEGAGWRAPPPFIMQGQLCRTRTLLPGSGVHTAAGHGLSADPEARRTRGSGALGGCRCSCAGLSPALEKASNAEALDFVPTKACQGSNRGPPK